MKTKILTALLLSLAITGCQKQPEEATAPQKTDHVAKAQFEKSDEIITLDYYKKKDNVQC